jgi:hypothetical protein
MGTPIETPDDKSAEPSVDATKSESTAATSTSELEIIPSPFPSFGTLFFGFVFIGVFAGAFVYFGGLRCARRVLSSGKRDRYQKLGGEADVEK